MGSNNKRGGSAQQYMIVADRGKKVTDLVWHTGTLQSAEEEAKMYAESGRFKIKRRKWLEGVGVFWRDVAEVGDYKVKWQKIN